MFMVGSFAAGLSEGLESGWKLGKDIQDRGYEEERRRAQKKANAEKADTTLPALKGIAAEAPSPTEAPPMLTGSTNLTADGYDPNQTYEPAKTTNGRVATGAKPALTPPWQSGIVDEKVPDNYKPAAQPAAAVSPATGPVVATAAIPPPLSRSETMETPDQFVAPPPGTTYAAPTPSWDPAQYIAPYVPQQGLGAAASNALRRALPAAQNWIGARVGEFRNAPPVQAPWFAQPGGVDRAVNQGISTVQQAIPNRLPSGSVTMPQVVGGNQGVVISEPVTGGPQVTQGPLEYKPDDRPMHYDPRTGQLVPY